MIEVHADNHFRTHTTARIGRNIVQQSAVNQHIVAVLDRLKQHGHRRTGRHPRAQIVIAVQGDFLATDKVDGNGSKRRGQLVVAFLV